VHLVGFTVEIYYDAQLYECQRSTMGHRNVSEVGEEVKSLQLTSTIPLGATFFLTYQYQTVHCYMSAGYVLSSEFVHHICKSCCKAVKPYNNMSVLYLWKCCCYTHIFWKNSLVWQAWNIYNILYLIGHCNETCRGYDSLWYDYKVMGKWEIC